MADKPLEEKAVSATLVVFGLDETGKPHASWFGGADALLAEKAAGLMKMKILRLATDEQKKIAGKLPQGRVFESGKAFVPFVNQTLYAQLAAMGGEDPQPSLADIAAALKASSEEPPSEPISSSDDRGVPDGSTWNHLGVGTLVLANETPKEGWYEAVVKEVRAEGVYLLTWRDWPHEAAFVRKAPHIALLHPANSK